MNKNDVSQHLTILFLANICDFIRDHFSTSCLKKHVDLKELSKDDIFAQHKPQKMVTKTVITDPYTKVGDEWKRVKTKKQVQVPAYEDPLREKVFFLNREAVPPLESCEKLLEYYQKSFTNLKLAEIALILNNHEFFDIFISTISDSLEHIDKKSLLLTFLHRKINIIQTQKKNCCFCQIILDVNVNRNCCRLDFSFLITLKDKNIVIETKGLVAEKILDLISHSSKINSTLKGMYDELKEDKILSYIQLKNILRKIYLGYIIESWTVAGGVIKVNYAINKENKKFVEHVIEKSKTPPPHNSYPLINIHLKIKKFIESVKTKITQNFTNRGYINKNFTEEIFKTFLAINISLTKIITSPDTLQHELPKLKKTLVDLEHEERYISKLQDMRLKLLLNIIKVITFYELIDKEEYYQQLKTLVYNNQLEFNKHRKYLCNFLEGYIVIILFILHFTGNKNECARALKRGKQTSLSSHFLNRNLCYRSGNKESPKIDQEALEYLKTNPYKRNSDQPDRHYYNRVNLLFSAG